MTVTLSKAQIEALSVELAKYGLVVKPAPRARQTISANSLEGQIARIRGMTFKTAGVKAAIMRNLRTAILVREARKMPCLETVLSYFGFKVNQVTPWPGVGPRWQYLANANPVAMLTYQPDNSPKRHVFKAPLWPTKSVYEPKEA